MTDQELLQQAHYVIKDFLLCVDEDCGVESCAECKPYRHAWDVERMIRERLAKLEQKSMDIRITLHTTQEKNHD